MQIFTTEYTEGRVDTDRGTEFKTITRRTISKFATNGQIRKDSALISRFIAEIRLHLYHIDAFLCVSVPLWSIYLFNNSHISGQ